LSALQPCIRLWIG